MQQQSMLPGRGELDVWGPEDMNQIHKCVMTALVLCVGLFVPAQAMSFCGFYVGGADTKLFNNATMVVMMREGTKTVLSMQNNYEGPPENFAMVVPVPVVLKKKQIKVVDRAVFDSVDRLAAPRLVEYHELNPCQKAYDFEDMPVSKTVSAERLKSPPRVVKKKDLGVTVKAKFDVGEYNVVILDAKYSSGLETWLKREKYNIPDGAKAAFGPYIQKGMYFFVAKVDIKKVKKEKIEGKERAVLSPLRFHYDAKTFSLPIRLGLLNANGKQDLIVHILARGRRFEVANYKNVAIPTNLLVDKSVKASFGSFYADLFDYTLKQNPGAVVTEYAWDSGSCDPCPTPPLSQNDLITLGVDVHQGIRFSNGKAIIDKPIARNWVLTRLHARYGLKEAKDDLVFRAAPPMYGGRGTPQGLKGTLSEMGAQKGGINNFQGRYIMLHPWEGEISCEKPVRGRWGAPRSKATAQNTAFAPRGKMSLQDTIKSPMPKSMAAPTGPHKVKLPKLHRYSRPSACTMARHGDSWPGLLWLVLGGLWWSRRRTKNKENA